MSKYLFASIVMLSFVACDNKNTGDNDANDHDTIVVQRDTARDRARSDYKINLRGEIDRLQARLDSATERRGKVTNQKDADHWDRIKADIQARIDRARVDLDEFNNRTDDNWDEFRSDVDARMDTMRKRWDSLNLDLDARVKKK